MEDRFTLYLVNTPETHHNHTITQVQHTADTHELTENDIDVHRNNHTLHAYILVWPYHEHDFISFC